MRMPSAVSTPSGVSQVTLAVTFPGSAHLSFTLGHLIFGGSISTERERERENHISQVIDILLIGPQII